jgi:hypothetical protein
MLDSGTKRKGIFRLEMVLFITERGIFIKARGGAAAGARPCHTRNIVEIESQKMVSSIDITAKRPPNDHSGNGLEKH